MAGDNLIVRTYASAMEAGTPHIVLKLDTTNPIEIGDFVSAFTSLADQYDRYIREEHPDLTPDAQIYVREVRSGCIEADLIPWLQHVGVPAVITAMDQILIVETFIKRYAARLGVYLKGDRAVEATKTDLKDYMGQVAAIANDPNGKSSISAAYFEEETKEKKVRAALHFDTSQAKVAAQTIETHKREIEHKTSADYSRVLMVFFQSNVKDAKLGKRTGERVVIEEISSKDMPLIYASDLAEQQIKHEIREAADNVYKKGFVVDINVETKSGKPVAYRVTNLHQVIDLP